MFLFCIFVSQLIANKDVSSQFNTCSVYCFLQLLNFETGEVTRCSNGLSWDEALSDLSCKPTVQTTQVIHTEPGERVTLTCMFMGSPVPRVAWFNPQGIFIHQRGIQSQSGKLSDLRVSGPQWVRGKSGYNQWLNLTIPKVTEEHIGDYKVRNIESKAQNIFIVVMITLPSRDNFCDRESHFDLKKYT